MTSPPAGSTRDRILLVAEGLFATGSYDDVTLRAITAAAGVNVAAVNYHFGSKDGLVDALLERRLLPFDRWRRQCLDELMAAPAPPSARAVVEVMALPLLELIEREPVAGKCFVSLLARFFLGRTPRGWTRDYQVVDYRTWTEALERALPELDPHERRIRWILAVDTLLVALGRPLASEPSIPDRWAGVEMREYAPALLRFIAAGLSGSDADLDAGLGPAHRDALDQVILGLGAATSARFGSGRGG